MVQVRACGVAIILLLCFALLGCTETAQNSSSGLQTSSATISAVSTSSSPTKDTSPSTAACDETLWDHVYNPKRLHRIEDCKTVTGTITAIRKEKDGDYHILIALDSQFSGMLNQKNISDQKGDLVLEPVCQNKVTQQDAESACENFTYPVHIPVVGEKVSVTGDYVLDAEHGWNELHPVYSINQL